MKVFICIMSGFFLWYSGLFLVNPPQIIAQDTEAKSSEMNKALLKQMIHEPLPPGIAPKNLPEPNSSGAKLLHKYCIQCHDIISPRMHSAEKWTSIFQRVSWHMQKCEIGERMSRTEVIKAPSLKEGAELLSYLKRHSLYPADQTKLGHLDTPSGMAFLNACTQCHALPDPQQHTTQEWPGVTTRMKHNMQFMHKPLIQPKEEALIVQFLQLSVSQ